LAQPGASFVAATRRFVARGRTAQGERDFNRARKPKSAPGEHMFGKGFAKALRNPTEVLTVSQGSLLEN
jgi:hypothetical protein